MGSTGGEGFASASRGLDAQNGHEDAEVRDKYYHKSAGLDAATQDKEQKLIDVGICT